MPRMENNGGDSLARGAVSATFRPMGEKLTREQWEQKFGGTDEPVKKAVYKFSCPVHGEFVSTRECFLSGGFPLYDGLYAKSACNTADCDEKATVSGYVEIE